MGLVARFPVFLTYDNAFPGYTGPRNSDAIYDAGGIWSISGLGIARAAQGEWAPFECGTDCYNSTHFLWGVTSSVLEFEQVSCCIDAFMAYTGAIDATAMANRTCTSQCWVRQTPSVLLAPLPLARCVKPAPTAVMSQRDCLLAAQERLRASKAGAARLPVPAFQG